VLIISQNQ